MMSIFMDKDLGLILGGSALLLRPKDWALVDRIWITISAAV